MAWGRNRRPDQTELTFQSLVTLLPDPWSADEFVTRVAAERRRPIRILPHDLTTGDATGYAVRRRNEDVIVVPITGVGARRDAIICHELAHIVLEHAPLLKDDAAFVAMLTPNCSPELVARFVQRDGYDTDDERAAEILATRLITRAQTRGHPPTTSGELDRLTTRLR